MAAYNSPSKVLTTRTAPIALTGSAQTTAVDRAATLLDRPPQDDVEPAIASLFPIANWIQPSVRRQPEHTTGGKPIRKDTKCPKGHHHFPRSSYVAINLSTLRS